MGALNRQFLYLVGARVAHVQRSHFECHTAWDSNSIRETRATPKRIRANLHATRDSWREKHCAEQTRGSQQVWRKESLEIFAIIKSARVYGIEGTLQAKLF